MNIVLVVLSGVFTAMAFDFAPLSFFAWFGLVPLLYVADKTKDKARVFFYGLLAGVSCSCASIFWMAHVHPMAFVGIVLYMSLCWGLFIVLAKYLMRLRFRAVLIALLWVILEYIRYKWGFFGWNLIAYSQADNSLLLGTADLFGPWGISFLIAYANALVFCFFSSKSRKRFVMNWSLLLGLIVAAGTYSTVKPEPVAQKTINVSLAQPNISQEDKWVESSYNDIFLRLKKCADKTFKEELLIFPEAAWPYLMRSDTRKDFSAFMADIGRKSVIGAVEEINGRFYNSALLVNEQGELISRYSKIKLVPFGEFVPLRRLFSFIPVVNHIGDITPGEKMSFLYYEDIKIAPLICFEDIFPELAAGAAAGGADVLLNITNDGWFKGYPQAYQHLLAAKFRAVETGRTLIRAANTGITGIISPSGQLIRYISEGGRDVMISGTLSAAAGIYSGQTFYVKYPVFFPVLSILLMLTGVYYGNKKYYSR